MAIAEDMRGNAIGTYRAVWQNGLRVRSGVELDSKVVESYPPGTCFDVFEQVGTRLRTPAGWVSELHQDQVRRMAERIDERVPVIARYHVLWSRGLRVRSGKEVDSPVVAVMPFGARFEVIERDTTYGRVIRLRTRTGWVSLYHSDGVRHVAVRVDAHWHAPRCPAVIAGVVCPDGEWCPHAEQPEQCCAQDCSEFLLGDKLEENGFCAIHTVRRKPSIERRSVVSTAFGRLSSVQRLSQGFVHALKERTSVGHAHALENAGPLSKADAYCLEPEEPQKNGDVDQCSRSLEKPLDEESVFDGDWRSRFEPHSPITIRAGIVEWADGSSTDIVDLNPTSFTALLRGHLFTASLQTQTLLSWSDGDTWLRYEDDDTASVYTVVSFPEVAQVGEEPSEGGPSPSPLQHPLPMLKTRSDGIPLQRFSIDTPRKAPGLQPTPSARLAPAEERSPTQMFVVGTPRTSALDFSMLSNEDEVEERSPFASIDYTGEWWQDGSLVHIEDDAAAPVSPDAESKRRSTIRRASSHTVTMASGAGDVLGHISADSRHIDWSNGSRWSREAPHPAGERSVGLPSVEVHE